MRAAKQPLATTEKKQQNNLIKDNLDVEKWLKKKEIVISFQTSASFKLDYRTHSCSFQFVLNDLFINRHKSKFGLPFYLHIMVSLILTFRKVSPLNLSNDSIS